MAIKDKELQGFAQAAHSLKLYRRADLRDDVTDKSLIGKLYVDPLPNDAVLETMIRDSTTFLIGRKGTGKSTVFQRAQHQLRTKPKSISAYVDIKTVYEQSDVEAALPSGLTASDLAINEANLKKVLLYRSFIRSVLTDVKDELKKQVGTGALDRLLQRVGLKRSDISSSIEDLLEGSFEAQYTNITGIKKVDTKSSGEQTKGAKTSAEAEAEFGVSPSEAKASMKGKASGERSLENKNSNSEEFSDIILRTFDINRVLEQLKDLLNSIDIKRLYIFIDDFSELPEEAMRVFVDTILAPLNNWSNELIKFKVAAYPGRIYLGKIDPTKIDEVYLDLYKLYGDRDVTSMELAATNFTQRLIESRFKHYVGRDFASFCDDPDNVFLQLYYASMANPRILGHLLSNLRDNIVAYERPIGARAVHDAAIRYYEEKVQPFFGMQKFAHESFSERASTFSLKELLESVVERARYLRDYKESRVTRELRGRTPSSHFYINSSLESALSTLELNFFLTLYYKMKDRDGNDVSVYALNYGLCQKYSITFGRPSGQREHRLYYVERIFDYTMILKKFLEQNQEIKCNKCGATHGSDKLSVLALYDMLCPACKKGTCVVTNLSRKYASVIEAVDPNLLLPATELGILETLYTEQRRMVASEIAGELDCSYQMVGKRGRNLAERGLVDRDYNEVNRRVFEITDQARIDYFDGNSERDLDLE